MTYHVLLVDDDISQVQVVEQLLKEKMHCDATIVDNGQTAIDMLSNDVSKKYDLVLLDLSMPGISGIDVLNKVKPANPNLPIIVRTGYNDLDMAIEAMKAGATDFVKKLDEPERLQSCINNALRIHTLNDELARLRRSMRGSVSFADIIGESAAAQEMISYGNKVAGSMVPVLLEGESGSGKELMARAIHSASARSDKPFITVNCGAIPENLVESILFGHEKGAFTGALYKTSGKFREANGGTLFLDEIGELSVDVQVKLLRVLQDGEIDPVGAKKTIRVDVRVISATHRDLSEEVKEQRFREDLYYRLNVFPIHVPPLRARRSDLDKLIDHFFKLSIASENKEIRGINAGTMDMLRQYAWPGNIRQLKNSIYRAVVLCDEAEISDKHFPQVINSIRLHPKYCKGSGQALVDEEAAERLILTLLKKDGQFKPLRDLEKEIIADAMKYYHGKMSEIARRLGIGRSTLYRKINDLGIEDTSGAHA